MLIFSFYWWGLQRRAETGSEVLMSDLRAIELRKKLLGIDVESPYTWLQCTSSSKKKVGQT